MNLVQTSSFTKKVLLVVSVLLGIYVFFLMLRQPVRSAWVALFPPKDRPTVAFGVLDPLEFTQTQTLNTAAPSFVLNTRTGSLPANLPTQAKVYKYSQQPFSYSAGEKAQADAQKLGFTDEMRISNLSDPVFVWQDIGFGGRLVINSGNEALELTTPMGGKGTLYPSGKLSRALALTTAKSILGEIGRFIDPLYRSEVSGFQDVVFGKFGPTGLVRANSTLEAQVAKVDFFRNIDNVPILGPNPAQGMLQVVLREAESRTLFPQLSFPIMKVFEWQVNTANFATYPLIPVTTAWNEVSQGNGVIVSVVPSNSNPFIEPPTVRVDQVLINEVYLAYFDNTQQQQYLQPIYVFEGNYTSQNGGSGDVFIYYPAISGEYVRSPQGVGQTSQL